MTKTKQAYSDTIEWQLYQRMCVGCECEKRCHELAQTCSDFDEKLEALEEIEKITLRVIELEKRTLRGKYKGPLSGLKE